MTSAKANRGMAFPKKERSNLPGNPILAHQSKLAARQQKLFQQLARDFQRETKGLFTKTDFRQAAEIAADIKKEWRKASVKLGGDSTKIDAAKASARKELERALAHTFPNYRKLRALQRERSRAYQKLVKSAFAVPRREQASLDWGNGGVNPNPDSEEFGPPFSLWERNNFQERVFDFRDESYVLPDSGNLVNNITLDVDESSFGLGDIYTFRSWVSCGFRYTMPWAGRLQIGAVLQNFYNKINYSVTDNFGFSSADVTIYLTLYINIVRPQAELLQLYTPLLYAGIVSDGEELSYTRSDLDITTPYTLGGITETLPAGEPIIIQVGMGVVYGAVLDDMGSHFDAFLWSQVKKVIVEVVS